MRYPGGKITRCLNRFCRLLLIQRRKRLFSEHPSTIWALTSEYHYPVHVHFSETRPHLELFSADLPPIVLFRLSPGCILFSSQKGNFSPGSLLPGNSKLELKHVESFLWDRKTNSGQMCDSSSLIGFKPVFRH